MTFSQYGVPADGWAPGVERPLRERSGTCVRELGPNQLAKLERRSAVFADAARRVEDMKNPTAKEKTP